MEELDTTEEVLTETQPTEEEAYDSEYDKAWDGGEETSEEVIEPEEELEQPQDESAEIDESSDTEVAVDSNEEVEEANSDESTDKSSDDFQEVLKWKGQEIPVTREELIALGQKGFDSEKKWQEAAVNRPLKEVIDKYGLTVEQLTMLGNISKDKS